MITILFSGIFFCFLFCFTLCFVGLIILQRSYLMHQIVQLSQKKKQKKPRQAKTFLKSHF